MRSIWFVISRSAVRFRALAPEKTSGYTIHGVAAFSFVALLSPPAPQTRAPGPVGISTHACLWAAFHHHRPSPHPSRSSSRGGQPFWFPPGPSRRHDLLPPYTHVHPSTACIHSSSKRPERFYQSALTGLSGLSGFLGTQQGLPVPNGAYETYIIMSFIVWTK